ncbi:phage tail protein I [Sphingosinicella sp. CPCC 101087]|uniref:phage tail protein I n=1 Tax=Sphingosinicella sp. CPCC 101087 TaxID=2497754 RepID=UPI00101DF3DC|nr:phage tail protein I [Sphingosinicella sp. CPCC 101087]
MTLLPPNATELERAIEGAIERLSDVPVPIRRLWNPATAEGTIELAYLAWALSIDSWSSGWPLMVRRERVRQAIDIQRHKGTSTSVRDVVESFGGGVALREWWQLDPPGEPHTFELTMTLTGGDGEFASAAFVDTVIAEVARTKPVRSHFTFTQGLTAKAAIGLVVVARPTIYARLPLTAPAAA